MIRLFKSIDLEKFTEFLEKMEDFTRPLFVAAAIILYIWSIFQLVQEVNPATELELFLVRLLTNLSIPFGVILLQEMFELVISISHSTLDSARRQFEVVVLVIVRSFFKSFDKVNDKVSVGALAEPVQEALVKVIAITVIVGLILIFRWLTDRERIREYANAGKRQNAWKQVVVVIMAILLLVDLLLIQRRFDELQYIQLVFTGLIVIDAMFLIVAILRNIGFDGLIFESGLVIALIFARFPLFTSNSLSYALSAVGVAFATVLLLMIRWALRLQATHEVIVSAKPGVLRPGDS